MRPAWGLLALVVVVAPARAQSDIEVDADYRIHDTVTVDGYPDPFVGTILEGREPTAPRLKFRTLAGVVTEFARDQVRTILDRETPETAMRSRTARIKERGLPGEHRLLGEWGLKHGLLLEAEAEVRLAADGERDAARSRGHRERLVELIEARLPGLEGEARDAAQEAILREVGRDEAASGGTTSPRLLLARARVAAAFDLRDAARVSLEAARAALEAKAREGAPPGGGPSTPPAPPGGGAPGGPEPTPPAPPPGPRFGRDGEGIDPAPGRPPAPPGGGGGGPAQPATPDDRSDQELPGLRGAERDTWREVHVLLGAVEELTGRRAEAARAWERTLAVWPQERSACLGLARLRAGEGRGADALALLDGALRCFPRDAELLLVRGEVRTLLAQDLGAARADLDLAVAAAGPADGPLGRRARTSLGMLLLVAGRMGEADLMLVAADAPPGHGPARLGRALVAECVGDLPGARTHYAEAARLLDEASRLTSGGGGEARYGLAAALLDAGEVDAAVAALREAARSGLAWELVARGLEDVARRRGDPAAEARLLELHVRGGGGAPSADLLARLGRAFLRQERWDEARRLFERGLAATPDHVACLRGLAHLTYRGDDPAAAKAALERVLALAPEDAWARQGLKNLEEARTRRVWQDGFDRPGPEPKNGWQVDARYGLKVELQDGRLYFNGRQQNEAGGKTRLHRAVQGERVVKLEVRVLLDRLGPNQRAGLRYETDRLGVVLFRDGDGRLKAALSRAQNVWEDPVDLGDWPGPGAHVLAIDVERPEDGTVGLLVDGARRGELKVPGIARDKAAVELAIYAQGAAVDDAVEVVVEDVRVFVRRDEGPRAGGGF